MKINGRIGNSRSTEKLSNAKYLELLKNHKGKPPSLKPLRSY